MGTIWIILKITIYTFILNVLFRQTYNFIFILWRKPVAWICIIALLSAVNMLLAFSLGWDPGLVSAAALIAFLLNLPLPVPERTTKVEYNNWIETFYADLGIKHGRQKYRIGLATFAIFSIAGYIVLFGEVCQLGNEKCVPVLKTFLS